MRDGGTAGFPAEAGKPGYFNFICPGPEIAWILPPKSEKTRHFHLAENMDKIWNVKIYRYISILY